MNGKWMRDGTLLRLVPTDTGTDRESERIAAFDFDGTLVKTKSGKRFATDENDWQWWHPCVPDTLQRLHSDGTRLVIFTNQGGIAYKGKWDPAKEQAICARIEAACTALGFPIDVFVAVTEDRWRKPSADMWREFMSTCASTIESALFVGDAAGRAAKWAPGKRKDHSCVDRKFAHNAGIAFQTPEEFFLVEPAAPFEWGGIDPQTVLSTNMQPLEPIPDASAAVEMAVLVGAPASGKSTLARERFADYAYVNRDTLKTQARCKKATREALQRGQSVVVDNTSPSVKARAEYVGIAQSCGVPVRCLHVCTPLDLCKHLNAYRERITDGAYRRVPTIAYNIYNKHFEAPTTDEGFESVQTVDFCLRLASEREQRLFAERT